MNTLSWLATSAHISKVRFFMEIKECLPSLGGKARSALTFFAAPSLSLKAKLDRLVAPSCSEPFDRLAIQSSRKDSWGLFWGLGYLPSSSYRIRCNVAVFELACSTDERRFFRRFVLSGYLQTYQHVVSRIFRRDISSTNVYSKWDGVRTSHMLLQYFFTSSKSCILMGSPK